MSLVAELRRSFRSAQITNQPLAHVGDFARVRSDALVGNFLVCSLLVSSGKLFGYPGLPAWDSAEDRAMLCGSPQMLAEMVDLLKRHGFTEGSSSSPGSYVIEKAFVEKQLRQASSE
jgi:hypothetical protein